MNNCISASLTISELIKLIDRSGLKTFHIVKKKKYISTISEHDIRKIILTKKNFFDEPLSKFFIKKKNIFFYNEKNISKEKINKILKYRIDSIPILNKKKQIQYTLSYQDLYDFYNKKVAFIFAGGKGLRLKKISNDLPKPLVKMKKNFSMLEILIKNLINQGFEKIYISLKYKSKLIKKKIKNSQYINKIFFIEEKNYLDSAGSLFYMKFKYENILVVNCDVLFDINYYNIFQNHIKSKNYFTMVFSNHTHQIYYGVGKFSKKGKLLKIEEKPKISYKVNSGVYCINNKILVKFFKKLKKLSMTNLIKKIQKFYKINYFYYNNFWIDLGTPINFQIGKKKINKYN